MLYDCPTPSDLRASPQLATIATLDVVLATTRAAIMAAHPAMANRGWVEDPPLESNSDWVGSAVIYAIDALAGMIRHYHRSLEPLLLPVPPPPSDNI